MIAKESVNAQDLRTTVQEVSQAKLPLAADGYTCTTVMVYDVLLKAASEGISIEAACADLDDVVADNTIRTLLNEQLAIEQIWAHERQINDAFA